MNPTIPAVGIGRVAMWMTIAVSLGIIFIGARFFYDPVAATLGFGVPRSSAPDAYFWTKGTRDIVSGLVPLGLLIAGQRRALGIYFLLAALTPVVDFATVLRFSGAEPLPLSIHGGTVAYLLVLAWLLLRQSRGVDR